MTAPLAYHAEMCYHADSSINMPMMGGDKEET